MPKENRCKRRNCQCNRLTSVVIRNIFCRQLIGIGNAAAAEFLRVRIENFDVRAFIRNADLIIFVDCGRKIADRYQVIVAVFRLADKGNYAVVVVVAVNPLEPVPIEINLPKLFIVNVELIQRLRIGLQLRMLFVPFDKVPIKAVVFIPLDKLPELAAHEQKLFAGMRNPVAEETS